MKTKTTTTALTERLDRWKEDPCAFIDDVLVDPETGKPFILYEEEECFLREAFRLNERGRLLYPDSMFSAPKKSGKTALAAMAALYVTLVLGGGGAEVYCLANDEEQAVGRVFGAIAAMVQASPLLRSGAKITDKQVTFTSTSATITAVASDYAGFAGVNPTLCIFDELWGYVSERSRRLWDEGIPSPARKISGRLVVTTAGFSGESELLEGQYRRGLTGQEISPELYSIPNELLMFWTHELHASWQHESNFLEQARAQYAQRPNQFLRLIENRFVSGESTFIDMADWDRCTDSEYGPLVHLPSLPVWVGVDASFKHDDSAIAVCGREDDGRVRLIYHHIFRPDPDHPLDFEGTIELTLRELMRRYSVRGIFYDPWQMLSLAQRLERSGLPITKFDQTTGNLTEASSNLYDLIKSHRLVVYSEPYIRKCVSQAIAVENPRGGWRIAKEKQTHKIDIVIALAQAALGTVKGIREAQPITVRTLEIGSAGRLLYDSAAAPRRSNYNHPPAPGDPPISTNGVMFVKPGELEPEPRPSGPRISDLPGHERGGPLARKTEWRK